MSILRKTTFKTLLTSSFALILLLLFATGCRPAELVDAKNKKKRRWPSLEDDKTGDRNVDDNSFKDAKVGADTDFSFDNYDSAVANLGSENNSNNSNDDVIISDIKRNLDGSTRSTIKTSAS
ncbi:hypothetical protein BKA61DRAFT_579824 [Leptodontidium sp. MPI-SDFR-AT-0119]|nr:hypothetical protein BKA61DRAFT_579824 [Leptodontidium sp. MPI-SDFR-AT-0119]